MFPRYAAINNGVGGTVLGSEWQVATAFIGTPILIFALYEFVGYRRRRRARALAHRSKVRERADATER